MGEKGKGKGDEERVCPLMACGCIGARCVFWEFNRCLLKVYLLSSTLAGGVRPGL